MSEDLALDRQRAQLLEIVAAYEEDFGKVDPDRVAYYESLLG